MLTLAGITQGLLGPARLRRIWAWATAQSPRGGRRRTLTLAILANRGRFLAVVTRPIRPEAPPSRVALRGREHLDRAIARGVPFSSASTSARGQAVAPSACAATA